MTSRPAATWTDHGFEVIALDTDDTDAARAFGAALGWGLDSVAGTSPMRRCTSSSTPARASRSSRPR